RTHSQVHAMDQVVLGLTVLRLGLPWQAVPDSSNFPVCSYLPGNYDGAKIMNVSGLHFHDSMEPQLWGKFINTLVPWHPQIRECLEPQGTVTLPSSIPWSLAREGLRMVRGVRRRIYYARSGFTRDWSMSR